MILDRLNPRTVLLVGVILMLIGVFLPLLMVLHILDPIMQWSELFYLILNFFAYACQIIGLVLGIIGVAIYTKHRKHK